MLPVPPHASDLFIFLSFLYYFPVLPLSLILPFLNEEGTLCFPPSIWITLYAIYISISIVFGVIVGHRRKMSKYDLENGTEEKEACRRDMKSGLKAITILWITPQFVFLLFGAVSPIGIFTIYFTFISGLLILYFLVLPVVIECHIKGSREYEKYLFLVACAHFLLSASLYSILRYFELKSELENAQICLMQFYFGVFSSPIICLNWVIDEFGFELLRDVEARQKAISLKSFLIFNITSTIIYYLFIIPNDLRCRLWYNDHYDFCHNLCFLISLFALVSQLLSTDSLNIFEFQLCWTFLKYKLYADCMVLWTGDIEYIAGLSWSDPREYSADDEEENDSDSTYPYEYLYEISDEDSTDSEDDCSDEEAPTEITISTKELECKVCLQPYSNKNRQRSPRILTKCGHTLCRKCCEAIRERYEIACPFCRKYTYLDDSVKSLPKNYAIIGLIQEVKTRTTS